MAVDAVLAKALAKAPDDRYRTCLEFASALRRACGIGGGPAGPGSRRDPTQVVSPADHPPVPPHDRTDLIGVVGSVPPGPLGGEPPPVAGAGSRRMTGPN